MMGRAQVASGGQEGGVLQDGGDLAALQLALDIRSGDARAGVSDDELLLVGQAVEVATAS